MNDEESSNKESFPLSVEIYLGGLLFWNIISLSRGLVGMSLMGSAKPINFENRVLKPIHF